MYKTELYSPVKGGITHSKQQLFENVDIMQQYIV